MAFRSFFYIEGIKMNVKKHFYKIISLIISLFITFSLQAADWPQWRGPSLNGSSTVQNLPESWRQTENILWVKSLPGPGGATPIIYDGKIFVSSMADSSNDMIALCFDVNDGTLLWEENAGPSNVRLTNNNPASPSPVTDGTIVIFLYGNGQLAAFDFEGDSLWSRNLVDDYGPFTINFGYSASPLLFQDKLFISVMRRDSAPGGGGAATPELSESYILALNSKTGDTIWKQPRPSNATSESMESYTTPMPFNNNGRIEILTMGSDHVIASDPNDGKELWRYEYQTNKVRDARIVPSILIIDDLIIGARYKHHGVFALKAPSLDNSTGPTIEWELDDPSPDVSTPLYYNNQLYVFNGIRGVLACVEPETGKIIWRNQINGRGPWRASLTGADNKLYCISEAGEAFVLAAGDEFKVLFETKIDETPVRSSIAVANEKIFIRTAENLYCIGK